MSSTAATWSSHAGEFDRMSSNARRGSKRTARVGVAACKPGVQLGRQRDLEDRLEPNPLMPDRLALCLRRAADLAERFDDRARRERRALIRDKQRGPSSEHDPRAGASAVGPRSPARRRRRSAVARSEIGRGTRGPAAVPRARRSTCLGPALQCCGARVRQRAPR